MDRQATQAVAPAVGEPLTGSIAREAGPSEGCPASETLE